jgi:serine/threonine protein kinase
MSTNIGVKRTWDEAGLPSAVDPSGNQYKIGKKIAEGASGIVCAVHMIGKVSLFPENSEWVYKRAISNLLTPRENKLVFRTERRVLEKIHSSGCRVDHLQPPLIDFQETVDTQGNYIESGYLAPRMDGNLRDISEDCSLSACSGILRGLLQIYDVNLLHLDIKDQNILFSRRGEKVSIRYIDFGLAMQMRTSDCLTTEYIRKLQKLFIRVYPYSPLCEIMKGRDLLKASYNEHEKHDQFVETVRKLQMFAVGCILFDAIVFNPIYPFCEGVYHPDCPKGWAKNLVLDTRTPQMPQEIVAKLLKNRTNPKLASFICRMVSLDPDKRPSKDELKQFISTHY